MTDGEKTIAELFSETTSSEAIKQYVATHALHPSPGVAEAGLAALSLRSDAATRESIDNLARAIQAFKESSDRYSRRILALPLALCFLTFPLTIPVAIPVVRDLIRLLRTLSFTSVLAPLGR